MADLNERLLDAGDDFRALVRASSEVLYRMNPEWTEMRQLGGGGFLLDTEAPTTDWIERYIPPEEHETVYRAIREAIENKRVFELEHRVYRSDGTIGWTFSRAVPLFDEIGRIKEWFGAASDVTARRSAEEALRSALADREALLKEVHHRVKNNLQVITSLLEMQATRTTDDDVRSQLEEACNRIGSIAHLHELLYRSGSFSHVQLTTYTRQIAEHLVAFHDGADRIAITITGDPVTLELDRAVSFGLFLNESISNACRHGLPKPNKGTLNVDFAEDGDTVHIRVTDSGTGFATSNFDELPTLGMRIIRALATQLGGRVEMEQTHGTTIALTFPVSVP